MKSDELGHMAEALHENCFEICGNKSELPFLSVQEGLCFRNCMTKFAVFYPTLRQNLDHADFRHYQQSYLDNEQKKNPELKKLASEPWDREKTQLMDVLKTKKVMF